MFWNEFRIHKTSKFGLFVNEIKPIKFLFTIAKFRSYLITTVPNVCFKKSGTKRSSVLLLSFVPVFLKQTLVSVRNILIDV